MKSTITWIISRVLSDYIEAINPSEFELELMKLQVKLANLTVKKDILIKNNIPCKINKGIVGGIEIKLSSITKIVPATFSLTDIFILSSLKPQAALDFARNIKSTEITEIEQFCIKENVSKKDLFEGTLGSILGGLTGKISNVHIRMEFKQDNIQMAAGIIIRSASLNDLNTSTSEDVFVKALKIEGFSIYLDSNVSKINTNVSLEEYKNDMRNAFNNHDFILKDFSFSGILEHSKKASFNKITVYTPGFDLALNSQQYQGALKINKDRMKMSKLMYYSPCGRPDEQEGMELEWFHYIHKAAYKKKYPLTVRFDDIKQFLELKKKKKLISEVSEMLNIPDKKKREKVKQKILRDVDGDMIVRLSSYCHMKNLLEAKKKIKNVKSKNYDEITQTISESIGAFNKQSFALELKSDQVQAVIFDGNPIGIFTICNIESNCNIGQNDIDFKASVGDIRLTNTNTGNAVLKMVKSTKCATVDAQIDQKNLKLTMRAGLVEPIIYADFPFLQRLGDFAKGSLDGIEDSVDFDKASAKLGQKSQLYINHIIETKYKLDADLTFGAPSIILPTPEEIVIKIGKFNIKSVENANPDINNPLSLYDKYRLTCKDFMIMNGSENILEPISMNVYLQNLFVPIPSMLQMIVDMDLAKAEFKLTRSQYLNLLKIADIIPKSEVVVEEEPKEEKKIVINKKIVNRAVEMTQQTTSTFSIQLGFLFKEASIHLLTEEGEIENQFKMNSMRTALEFFNGKLDAEFNIQKLLATQGVDKVFCKFGDDALKAFDVHLLHSGNNTKINVLSDSPTITVDPEWIIELQHFFEVINPNQEEKKLKPRPKKQSDTNTIDITKNQIYDVISENKTEISVRAEIKTPELRVVFPMINSSESQVLSFGFDSLSTDISISDSKKVVGLSLERMYFSLNTRHVLDPVSANLSLDFTKELILNGGLPIIRIILDHSDLLLAQDMLQYVNVHISNLLRKSEPKEIKNESAESSSIDKSIIPQLSTFIEGMQLIINEGGVSTFAALVNRTDIHIGEVTSIVVSSAEISEKITSSELTPFFKLDHNVTVKIGERIDVDIGSIEKVKFSHNVACWLVNMAINPAYEHIIDIPADMRVEKTKTKKTETKQSKSTPMFISLSNFSGDLEYEDKTFASMLLYDIFLKVENGITFDVDFLDVQCPDLGSHSNMLSVNKLKLEMEGKDLNVDIKKLYFGYQQDFILDRLLNFVTSILPPSDEKANPINLPLFNYKVRVDVANIGLIPRDLSHPTFAKVFNIQLDTEEDMKTLVASIPCGAIYDASGVEIGKINDIKAKINFETSSEIPQPAEEFKDYDTSYIITEGKNFLHNTNITLRFDFLKFLFDNNSNRRLVNCLNSLIPPPSEPKVFPFNMNVSVKASEYAVTIASQRPIDIVGSNFGFTFDGKQMCMEMGLIACYNMHGDTPFLEIGMEPLTGFTFTYKSVGKDSECTMNVESPRGLLDLPAILVALPYAMNSGFMDIGTPKSPNETEKKGNLSFSGTINNMFLEALVADEQNMRLFAVGSFFFSKTSGIQFDVNGLQIGFCDGKDYEHPICRDINASYFSNKGLGDTSHTVYVSKINAIISTIDIGAALTLLNSIQPYLNFLMDQMSSSSLTNSEDEDTKKDNNNRQNMSANIGNIHLALAFAGKNIDGTYREAFQLDFDNFVLTSSENDYNAIAAINNFQYFCPSTRQWDTVIEPFKLALNFRDNFLDISGTSLKVNFSTNIINEVMRLLDEMKSIQEDSKHIEHHIKGLPYFLVNNLGESLFIGKEEIKPSTEKQLFGLSDGNTITIKVHNQEFQISIGELFYPNFLFRNVVCYFKTREDRREVVLSSAIIFSTQLKNLVLVSHNPDSKAQIKEHTQIPFNVSSSTEFHIERENIRPQVTPTHFKYHMLRRGTVLASDGLSSSNYVLIPNYDVNSGVLKVNIMTNSYIRNELPEPIMVRFGNAPHFHEIAPYDNYGINLIDNVKISIYIKNLGERSMGSFTFFSSTNKYKMGMNINGRTIDFLIENIYDEDNRQRTIRFYAPCVVFNSSPFAFSIINQHKKMFGEATKDPIYVDASNYINDQQLIVKPYIYEAPPNGVDTSSISSFVLPKHSVISSAVLPLNGVVTSVSGAPSTRIVTFFSALHIDNHLDHYLWVSPYSHIDGNSYEIPPGRLLALKCCSKSGEFFVSLDKKLFAKFSIHPRNRESFILQGEDGVRYAVEASYEKQGCNTSLILTRCPVQGPIVITNETDITFGIMRQSFIAFSSQSLHGPMPDSIPIAGIFVKINDGNPAKSPVGDLFAYTTWLSSGSLQITVSRKPLVRLSRKITVRGFLSELSLSFIDAYCRETLLLTLYQVSVKTNPQASRSTVALSIKTIKVDDMHNAAAFPAVAVITADNKGNPGFRASVDVIYGRTSFDNASIGINPIYLYVDGKFVNDAFMMAKHAFKSPNAVKKVSIRPAESIPSYAIYDIERLSISAIRFIATFRAQTGRPAEFPFKLEVLRKIPNLTGIDVKLNPVSIQHLSTDSDDLSNQIIAPYMRQLPVGQLIGGLLDSLTKQLNYNLKRERPPLCILGRQIAPYNEELATYQAVLCQGKRYKLDVVVERGGMRYALTPSRIFVTQGTKKLSEFPYNSILSVQLKGGDVILKGKEREIKIETGSNEKARTVLLYIRSHIYSYAE